MTNLRSLKIIFQGGESITNHGVRTLLNAIGKCVSLQDLDLRFIVCNNISDEALSNWEPKLKRLIHLKNVVLHFDWCSRISDKGIEEI